MNSPTITLLNGDCREVMRALPEKSIHAIITSSPYWMKRKYNDPPVVYGGDAACVHEWRDNGYKQLRGNDTSGSGLGGAIPVNGQNREFGGVMGDTCTLCGAWRGELGWEPTPQLFVAHLVEVFAECWRVLRDDGLLFVNLMDTRVGSVAGNKVDRNGRVAGDTGLPKRNMVGLKPKDMALVPQRFVIAMQEAGWYVRSTLIWAKGESFNPYRAGSAMPESARDRPTDTHEYIFMFSKGKRITRIVKFSDFNGEILHFSKNLGAQHSYMGTSQICIELATSIFNTSQSKYQFSLPPFYSEIWQQGLDGENSLFIGCTPEEHRATIIAARLLAAHISTKEFLCELNRIGVTLTNGNKFLITGIDTKFPLPRSIFFDGDTSIGVNNSGKISKIDFVHESIITQSHQSGTKYYSDMAAVAEAAQDWGTRDRTNGKYHNEGSGQRPHSGLEKSTATRNLRSVWTLPPAKLDGDVFRINTRGTSIKHYATWCNELAETMIRMSTSEHGACSVCGAGWERVVKKKTIAHSDSPRWNGTGADRNDANDGRTTTTTTGWRATCAHTDAERVPSVVLDPFGGSGTTGRAAYALGRNSICIELKQEYHEIAEQYDPTTEKPELPVETEKRAESGQMVLF